ncbi:MAG TPA: zinc-dependent metalloprotease [Longimicrobiales bacterium]|nr:zinc-dependent metalloprotease [Longimicrobiales bacterium]
MVRSATRPQAILPGVLLLALLAAAPAAAQEPLPTIAEKTRGMERLDGFVPLHWDARAGKLWLEVPFFGRELLYINSMPAGMGSNDIGLDRGQLGGDRIVFFERVGPRVLLRQPNYRYRADTDNPDERRSVEEAFATSVLWGFEVAAEEGGRVLVDATEFAIRDAHGVEGTLQRTDQGTFRLERSRSALYLPRTKAFPRNTEIEVTLTFTGERGGGWVREVTPSPDAITVRQRHSFVALPEPGFEPRASHPAAGYGGVGWRDYAVPLGAAIDRRVIARHRLKKRDPAAAVSEPVEPIVYYLDRGAPEPVRTALLEGARWWNQAFEAAGYRDAFRVELLPEGADPMDVRYNVINWVHRSTRGWSYGSSVVDPRTGEIIKGHVTLGSLRVRQDYMIAEGLLAPYAEGDETPPELAAMALARIRQLSAHEVGHTLGLSHNYISSAEGRTSVMDYPHPLARLTTDGHIDLSDAYREGIGEWDEVAITYGYQDFPPGTDEEAALSAILLDARAEGITFLADQDARPAGSAHPQVHLWDNERDAAAELGRMMEVRRVALSRFGEAAIQGGRPLATLEEVLVPLYLHHRYQVEAAAKVVGGQYYTYALRGDAQEPLRPVPAGEQEAALSALLLTLRPAELALPRRVIELIPPRPFTFGPHRELFDRWTGLVFDPVSPSAAAAGITVSMLLHPERAARLVQQEALDPGLPGLADVLDRLVGEVFGSVPADGYEAEVSRTVRRVVAEGIMGLAASAGMPQARALAMLELEELQAALRGASGDASERAFAKALVRDIERFFEDPSAWRRPPSLVQPPPGSPIGSPR